MTQPTRLALSHPLQHLVAQIRSLPIALACDKLQRELDMERWKGQMEGIREGKAILENRESQIQQG